MSRWMALLGALVSAALLCFPSSSRAAETTALVTFKTSPGAIEIASAGRIADIRISSTAPSVVRIAAKDLADDLKAITGALPRLLDHDDANTGANEIWIGVLGQDARIDRLATSGKLKLGDLKGAWESFVIASVPAPTAGVRSVLVIVGSDPRGAAYGAYELSQAAGVSPWTWWADVPAQKHDALYVPKGARRFGPPSVKYRGLFINDEDWGLQPWAARTFDPERGDIGPKTYEKVFQLMLRLKANTLWPAMHEVTAAFNSMPENRELAARYGIVMGSSHAEPMLRNNVGEWKHGADAFDYTKNRDGVRAYWDQRVRENGRFENIYTLGMRGIHDSGIVGPKTLPEKRAALEQIFADQRAMLAQHVDPKVEKVPQVFTPYKEVLDVYDSGLKVPDDVTLVWPDDNFGYIRRLPNAAEQARSGGSGVYYHLSYLGAPLSYLWLSTTPPALIWEEMTKAYDHGARQLWVVNVGDIKPAEMAIDFFMQLAWDRDRWTAGSLPQFYAQWAGHQFGPDHASEIAEILAEHDRLNFERRPEHLQWWLAGERYRFSPWTSEQAQARLDRFERQMARVEGLEALIHPDRRDAFFELVSYPVRGAALANVRLLRTDAYRKTMYHAPRLAGAHADAARSADATLKTLTLRYNQEIAGGKWNRMIAEEPADPLWPNFRIAPIALPAPGLAEALTDGPPPLPVEPRSVEIVLEAEAHDAKAAPAGWTLIPGLGRGAGAMKFNAVAKGGNLTYRVKLDRPGTWRARIDVLPTFLARGDGALEVAITVDGGHRHVAAFPRQVTGRRWSCEVLDNLASATLDLPQTSAGDHVLAIQGLTDGLVVDRIILTPPGEKVDRGCSTYPP